MANRKLRRADVIFVLSWFTASRLALASAGVTHHFIGLEYVWQLAPLELLRTRYVDTLWYLHSQPPLYNALVGIALALPGSEEVWIHAWWIATGLCIACGMLWAFLNAGIPRIAAHLAVVLFGLNPSIALYENFVFYSYPEAACVLGGFIGLLIAGRGDARGSTLAAVMGSLLVLLRSAFQLPWAIAMAVAASAPLRHVLLRRLPVAIAFAPALVAGVLTVKNAVMFDVWASSSWYGMNMTNVAAKTLSIADPTATTQVLFAFRIGAFVPISEYPSRLRGAVEEDMASRHGRREILNNELKTSGSPNFNHVGYLAVSRRLAQDSVAIIWRYPGAFRLAVREGLIRFFRPTSEFNWLTDNRKRLESIERVYTRVLYPGNSSVLVILSLIVAVLSATYFWVSAFTEPPDWLAPAAGYLLVTTTWLTLVGNLTEYGENSRFRFTLDPTIFTWNVLIVWRAWCYLSSRHTQYAIRAPDPRDKGPQEAK